MLVAALLAADVPADALAVVPVLDDAAATLPVDVVPLLEAVVPLA